MSRFGYTPVLLLLAQISSIAAAAVPTEPRTRIALPGVQGRIDHMAVDVKGQKLFVAALGNHSVEVIDLTAGRRVHSIPGLREPQGIVYVPALDRFVVACAGDGSCRIFDGRTYLQTAQIDCKEDADNVRLDAVTGHIYVGYGSGALGIVDMVQAKRIADIPLAGHPESFQLQTAGQKIFVNVPSARQIAVVDRNRQTVVAVWPVVRSEANFPMALDETHRRLFVGCRKPARLLVLDSENGTLIASLPCVGDADDLFYDAKTKRIYVAGGEGAIHVFYQVDADHYRLFAAIPTAIGARTGLFVSPMDTLYLAVPLQGTREAEIRGYRFPE